MLEAAKNYVEFVLTAAFCFGYLILIVIVGAINDGWTAGRDELNNEDDPFQCETDRGGFVRQPLGVVSSLSFFVASLLLAYWTGKNRLLSQENIRPRNLLTTTRFYPCLYCLVLANLGGGGIAFHTSLTRWGSLLDFMCVLSMAIFLFLFSLARYFQGPLVKPVCFTGMFATLVAVVAALLITLDPIAVLSITVMLVFVGFLVCETAIYCRIRKQVNLKWFGLSFTLFFVASAAFALSTNEGVLCVSPKSWFQGHSVWHVLAACSFVPLFLYFASETHDLRSESSEQRRCSGEDLEAGASELGDEIE